MDNDRIAGAASRPRAPSNKRPAKHSATPVADGKSDMVEGKIQNAVGGLTDALEK